MENKPMEVFIIGKREKLNFNLVRQENELKHIYIDNNSKEYELKDILRDIDNKKNEYKTRKEFYKKWFSQWYKNINYEDFTTLYFADFAIERPYMLNEEIFLSKEEMIKRNATYDFVFFDDIEYIFNSLKGSPYQSKKGTIYGYSKQYNKDTDTFTYSFTFFIDSCYVHTEKIELKEDITNSRNLYEMGEKISKEKNIKNMEAQPQPYWDD